jgi:hypothetical protein
MLLIFIQLTMFLIKKLSYYQKYITRIKKDIFMKKYMSPLYCYSFYFLQN